MASDSSILGHIDARGWFVEFFRAGDRIAQRVYWQTGAVKLSLAESVEGAPEAPWPASPPWQQLHFERRAEGQAVALLVGMAGRSHWSASVQVEGVAGALVWDIACRVQEPPQWLGSTFRPNLPLTNLAGDSVTLFDSQSRLTWRWMGTRPNGDRCPLDCEATTSHLLRWKVHVARSVAIPATIRWGLRLSAPLSAQD